ncbi:DUF952 domain-containing protein [Ornithinimicrobium tianjinense]|uniref:DUF952 domain-containing protein n=1 Tax=Ornithinimicrobium tianjinense TaxID=1195761 RepID=A0A917F1J3_9MICO|nr:DUF952 domain-containing protein [Ornithinimicrobium tianjinense]GGF43423.1 hypothetical protein GCM10011366_09070 [Ornithinimicrobium tianjinense]
MTHDDEGAGRPLWHLAELAHWEAALRTGTYERSTRGATLAEVGFIHASYPEQLPGVAKLLYSREDLAPLVVLEVDPAALAAAGVEVRLEPGDPGDPTSPHFPHLYGPLPVAAVSRTRPAAVEKGWLDLGPWEDLTSPGAGSAP